MASILSGLRNVDATGSHFNSIGRDQHNTTINVNFSPYVGSALAALKPVDRTGYYVPPCMPGTRRWIVERIHNWLNDPLAPNILWLSGSPGAGKSTIASTMVSSLEVMCQLGSYFPCKRGDPALSDPAAVWRTIAFDLARRDSAIARRLVMNLEAGKANPDRADIESHFRHFIEDPLTDACKKHMEAGEVQGIVRRSNIPILVVVLDALDECGPDGSQAIQRRIFMNTLTCWSHLPPSFKILVTSRDDRITPSFRKVCQRVALDTGDLASNEAIFDIQIFFKQRLAEIGALHPSLYSSWPGSQVIKQLTDHAAGLFIWAETVIQFLEQGSPKHQLDLVLHGGFRENGDAIDVIYRQILQLSFQNCKGGIFDIFKRVVGAIVLAKTPLYRGDLRHFLGRPEDESSIDFVLQKLSSIIQTRHGDGRLSISHSSFAEFVCDSRRCDKAFVIDRGIQSRIMALSCLQIMKAGLRFNICQLETPYVRNSDIVDLATRIVNAIPTCLSYSCRFFADHLQLANVDVKAISEVKDFLETRFLYWLEVLSLIQEVKIASLALLRIREWGKVSTEIIIVIDRVRL
jgi:hypothetical protein